VKKPKEEWRHLALLVSLLFLFVITPVVAVLRHGVLVMNVIAATVLVAGTYALSERKRLFAGAVILSGISIIGTWLLLITQQRWAAIFSHTCVVLLILYFSVTILGYVLQSGKVTTDRIFAAICVYMLIGYAWTFAYALVEELQPGAFLALSQVAPNDYVSHVLEMRYFSFMTLTTVGYGDILPRSAAARSLAALEGVTGQIYLTVLVARLVGLHIVHAHTSSERD
jgi:voltage-gated potassium channel